MLEFIKNNVEHIAYVILFIIFLLLYYYIKKKHILNYYHCLKIISSFCLDRGYSLYIKPNIFKMHSKFIYKQTITKKNEYPIRTIKAYANKKYIFFSINEKYPDLNIDKTYHELFHRSIKNVFYYSTNKMPLEAIYDYYSIHVNKYIIYSSYYMEIKYPIIDSILDKILIKNDLAIIISLLISILGALPILLKSIISIIVNIII